MTLAESTVFNAVRHSMMKNCFANLIIAGPICAGKKSIAQTIAEFYLSQEYVVTIIDQDSYYKEYEMLEDTNFGVKNIDSKSAFDTKKFVRDVRKLFEEGSVLVPEYNLRRWTRIPRQEEKTNKWPGYILKVKDAKKINIFVGPHAIELLTPHVASNLPSEDLTKYVIPYHIPEAICIYLNTNHKICMERREKENLMYPNSFDEIFLSNYNMFVKEQTDKEIAHQMSKAHLIINCDE